MGLLGKTFLISVREKIYFKAKNQPCSKHSTSYECQINSLLLPPEIIMYFWNRLIYRCNVYSNVQNKSVCSALMCLLMHFWTRKSFLLHWIRKHVKLSKTVKCSLYDLASGTSLRLILLLSTPYLWMCLSYLGLWWERTVFPLLYRSITSTVGSAELCSGRKQTRCNKGT